GRPFGLMERCSRKRSGPIRSNACAGTAGPGYTVERGSAVLSVEDRQGSDRAATRHHLVARSTLSRMTPRHLKTVCVIVMHSLAIGGLAAAQASRRHEPAVQQNPFGTQDGRTITLYTLTNANGV